MDPPRWRPDEVRVWRVDLDAIGTDEAAAVLDEDERARAARFRRPRDRHRFSAARAALRGILGTVLGTRPQDIPLVVSEQGRPYVAGDAVRFNVSHAEDLALVAVTADREIGVDVERVRPDVPVMALARRFFSAPEAERLRGLPVERRLEAFFWLWVHKEAYVKARGDGLRRSLDAFTVAPGVGEFAHLDDPADASGSRWSLRALALDTGYLAALAAGGPIDRVTSIDWLWDHRRTRHLPD